MSRSRRFEQRIKIERAALEITNTSGLALEEKLAGLTAAAIESWTSRIKGRADKTQLDSVHETLTSIATVTGLLSDNSRAVFSGSEHGNQNVDSLLHVLRTQCDITQPSATA